MSIEVTDLTNLDVTAVQQSQQTLAELLQEYNPTLDMKRGVLHDLLLYLGGILETKSQTEVDRLRRSMSLQAVQEDPTLAETDVVDAIASNYRVSRLVGGTTSGTVTVVIDSQVVFTLAIGTIFEAQGKQFHTEQAFTSRASAADVTTTTDRVLTPRGDGTYSFDVEVVAAATGAAYDLSKNTLVLPNPSPSNFVTSYAASDFRGGSDTESNAELVSRLVYGLAAKALSGRINMSAAVRAETQFVRLVADSIVGYGDQEMLRDQHSIFPGSLGGRVDWYMRTQALPNSLGFTKTATLIDKTVDGYGTWQISFGRDEAPGFYEVTQITPLDRSYQGSYEITEDIRSEDLTALDNDGFLPDLVDWEESVYSRFQAVIIRFTDTDIETADLVEGVSTQDYSVTVKAMPLIGEAQDYAAGRDVRNVAGDILVKAPIPCFLQVSFNIELPPGQETPDVDQIADDLASLVNIYGFTGRLPASALADVVHNHLEGVASTSAIDMFGRIRRPDGVDRYLRSTELLEVPDEPDIMVSGRTVAFFLDPNDVAISVTTANVAQV